MSIRPFWVLVHRYAGLAMTGFLIIVGLTGSLLAFYSELEHVISPGFFVQAQGREPLDLVTLIERAEKLAPEAQVEAIWLDEDRANISVSPRNEPISNKPYSLNYDELILDPFSSHELGRRTWGAISEGTVNLMSFVYTLHYQLALDETGLLIMGVTALVWTLDCFVGFYLTLPMPPKKHNQVIGDSMSLREKRSFWRRWRPAWKIKSRGSAYRIQFDLHRAGGLWLWGMLLVFAWSSVYMNLWDSVYAKVTQALFEFHEPWTDLPKLEKPLERPKLGWRDAYRIGGNLMVDAAQEHGFEIKRPVALRIDRELGAYVYVVRSSLDIQDRGGSTQVCFDADTGAPRLLQLPKGQYDGNTVTTWLAALHMGNVFGMPYRIFVCLLGLAIVMLSVTGVVIWQKKRRARKFHSQRRIMMSVD